MLIQDRNLLGKVMRCLDNTNFFCHLVHAGCYIQAMGDICKEVEWIMKPKRTSCNDVLLPLCASVSGARWDRRNYHHQTSHWKTEPQEGWAERERVRDVNWKTDTRTRTDKTAMSQITCQSDKKTKKKTTAMLLWGNKRFCPLPRLLSVTLNHTLTWWHSKRFMCTNCHLASQWAFRSDLLSLSHTQTHTEKIILQ